MVVDRNCQDLLGEILADYVLVEDLADLVGRRELVLVSTGRVGGGALLAGGVDEQLGDQRAGQGGGERVHALVQRARGQRGEAEVLDEHAPRVHHVREAVTTALQLRAFARAADDQDPTRHGLPPTSSIPEWSNRRAARTAPFVPGASRGSARRQVCETHLRGAPCLLESGTGVRIERTELRNVHHPIP